MAAVLWDDQVLCTYDELLKTKLGESALTHTFFRTQDIARIKARVNDMILEVRDQEIKPIVLKYFANKYPGKWDEIIAHRNRISQRAQERLNRSRGIAGVGDLVLPASDRETWNRFTNETVQGEPDVYFCSGAPTNGTAGTEAGTAKNGSWLVDSDSGTAYRNTGSETSPTWTEWKISGLVDLMTASNFAVLKDAGLHGLIWKIHAYSESLGEADALDRLDLIGKKSETRKKEFHEKLNLALPRLEPDLSGDGLISAFERSDEGECELFY